MNVVAVGQAHEGGQFAPSEWRAIGAELNLINVQLAERGLKNAVHAVVVGRQAEFLKKSKRRAADGERMRRCLRGFRGGLPGHAAQTRCRTNLAVVRRRDSPLEFIEAVELHPS